MHRMLFSAIAKVNFMWILEWTMFALSHIKSEKTHVSFFCRYSHYIEIVDSILEAFAAEQSLVIESRENSPTN